MVRNTNKTMTVQSCFLHCITVTSASMHHVGVKVRYFVLCSFFKNFLLDQAVADPGFPVGGHGPRRGDMDSRGSCVSSNLYVKTKELGPLGGHVLGVPP